jgi:hypothetical protein
MKTQAVLITGTAPHIHTHSLPLPLLGHGPALRGTGGGVDLGTSCSWRQLALPCLQHHSAINAHLC